MPYYPLKYLNTADMYCQKQLTPYVSDPEVWRKFYKNMLEEKFRPEQYKSKQTGGAGIAGMYANKPYIIPVNRHGKDEEEEMEVQQVTPVAASLERAKSEYKRKLEEGRPVVPLIQTGGNKIRHKDSSTPSKVRKMEDVKGWMSFLQ